MGRVAFHACRSDRVRHRDTAHCTYKLRPSQELEEGEPEADQENPIKMIASKIAGNLVRLGRGLRDAAQDVLVNIGFQIHALL